MITAGEAMPLDQRRSLLAKVPSFEAFDEASVRYFWKIACYDRATEMGSPDPADPEVTTRVLTILRADEY